ncbi:sensor domain-containing diguanylate cyclase [Azospirillum sp.]|uniref:sensor domain-containing diguanylate cyclase n=1 Tax=Azospirillum sp. TaxID=34012 RepID=UPI002D46CF55|nr:diguanylate cyclase [Azospirillum sp.]HYD67247.1 diguanylate cyclase [Azospirillum sp.]
MKSPLSGSVAGQIVAATLAVLIALLASTLWTSRQTTLRMAEVTLLHDARLHGQQIDAALSLVDFTLREMGDHLKEIGGIDRRTAAPVLRRHLLSSRTAYIGLYDGDGRMLASVGRPMPQLASLATHEVIRRHRDEMLPFQYQTATQLGLTGRPLVGLSRAVVSQQGQFLGLLLALVDVESPGGYHYGEDVHAARHKLLFDAAGLVLATWTLDEAKGGEAKGGGEGAAPAAFADVLRQPARTAAAGTGDWIVVVHQLADFPLRLGAALPRDQALTEWRGEVRTLGLTLGVCLIMLAALLTVLTAQSRRRETAEAELHDQLAFQRTLLDTIPLPVFWKEPGGRYLGCNAAYETFAGIERAAIIGHTMAERFGAGAAPHEEADRTVLEQGTPVTLEDTLRFPDGAEHTLLVSKAAFSRADGGLGGVVGVVVDVTERRHAEARMAALTKALDYSPAPILITDAQGLITYVNAAFTATTGYQPDEVVGRSPRVLRGETPEPVYRELWATITAGRVWHGEFRNRRKTGELYWEKASIAPILAADGRIVSYVAVKEDVTEQKRAAERMWEQANFDPLTGLPNRTMLHDRLLQALDGARHGVGRVALLYVDLDRFKPVNDSFGHEAGDALLAQVATRLRACVRDSDTVARLGGDEFVVLMPVRDDAEADQVARRILEALQRPFPLDAREDGEVGIGASIGISVYPRDGADAEGLLKNADAAMYAAKQAGRDTVRFFSRREEALTP